MALYWDLLLTRPTQSAEALLVIAILAELVVTFVSVCSRYLINHPIAWTDEIGVACLSLITFFLNRMPEPVRRVVQAAAIWTSLIFVGFVLSTLSIFMNHSLINKTPILRPPSTVAQSGSR